MLLLFTFTYDGSSVKLLQGTPHSFGRNAQVKTFARAYTNHLKREPTHPPHTREILARQIFMHHKTEDTNFILNLGEKLSVILCYFHFSQSSYSDFSFTLSVSAKPKVLILFPTYFTDNFIESVEVHPQKEVSNNGQPVE